MELCVDVLFRRLQSFNMSTRLKKDQLSAEGKKLLDHISNEFAQMKNHFTELSAKNEKDLRDLKKYFTDLVAKKDEKISELEEKIVSFQKSERKFEQALDDANQYERKDSVILSGPSLPDFSPNEDTHAVVRNLLETNLKLKISNQDICITHRLGSLKAGANRRNIYVKFVRRDVKREVIMKSKQNKQAKNFYANESLTPVRMEMFRALRGMKKKVPHLVKGCTTVEGKVFAFTPPVAGGSRDQKHWIRDMQELREFCRDHVKEALDSFLQNTAA